MTHRPRAAERRRTEWARGIRPRLDASTYGQLKMRHQRRDFGDSCKQWPDYLTELYHAGRACADPLLNDARLKVSGASVKHQISIKVDFDDVLFAQARANGSKKSSIAKTFAAMVCVGFVLTGGNVGCVQTRDGIYL